MIQSKDQETEYYMFLWEPKPRNHVSVERYALGKFVHGRQI